MSPLVRRLLWAAQPVVIMLVLWLAIDGPQRDVRDPLVFVGSGLVTLAEAKSVIDQGSWWILPEFGTPPGDKTFLPLRHAHLDLLLVQTAHLFSSRPAAVVNLAWALMLIVAGAVSAWCLRRLGVSMAGAWSAGVLFALCPVALGQNTHNFGVMPYLVPLAATAALQLGRARPLGDTRRGSWALFAGAAILGFNALLTALFGALIIAVGAVAGSVRSRRRAPLVTGAALLAAMILASLVNVATMGDHRAGPAPGPAASEVYGLKIRQLVTPLRDHWFAPFRTWALKDDQARFPNGTDNDRLGLIATVGFLGLLVVLFVPSAAGAGDAGETMRVASRLTLAAILFATLGGFGSVVSLLVSSALNDLSGITPFLSFLALAGVALAVDRATARETRRRWRAAVWACLLVVGLFDQAVAALPIRSAHLPIRQEVLQLRALVSALEGALPSGALVLQLPVRPEAQLPGPGRMRVYDNFKPWLVSRTLRWSSPDGYGAHARWQTDAAEVAPADLPAYVRNHRVSAILIDKFGFRDGGTAILGTLQADPQRARLVTQDARYVALDVREP